MKIIFFGTSEFAVPALAELCRAGFEITVITTPDKPAGRKKVMTASPIKEAAQKLNLPVMQPQSLKDDAFFEEFKKLEPDFGVAAAYGKIIPEKYIAIPKSGFLNIHPSLLPKYRGPTPVQAAILNGETETGISIMQIDAEMDHGPIYVQKKFQIEPDETYSVLHNRLAMDGAKLLLEVIQNFGSLKSEAQNHDQATFCKIYKREDGKIDWNQPAEDIYNQIRALNPEPGTWTTWQNKILNIKSALLNNTASVGPGITCKEDGKIIVGTGTIGLELKEIQLEGKKDISAIEFSHGHPDFVDSKLN